MSKKGKIRKMASLDAEGRELMQERQEILADLDARADQLPKEYQTIFLATNISARIQFVFESLSPSKTNPYELLETAVESAGISLKVLDTASAIVADAFNRKLDDEVALSMVAVLVADVAFCEYLLGGFTAVLERGPKHPSSIKNIMKEITIMRNVQNYLLEHFNDLSNGTKTDWHTDFPAELVEL